ncbi:MAG: DUF4493 domain-containing protein [Bacteroidaceae bacterium]
MKVRKLFFCMTACTASLLCSCMSDEHDFDLTPSTQTGYGSLTIGLAADAQFSDTRALSEESYRNTANYSVKLYNASNDNVLVECKYSEIASYLPKKLEIGSYRIEASYGKEWPASRDQFLVTGSKTFTIRANEDTQVNVDCTPTCGRLSVAFDASMATYFDDYNVVYGGTKAMGSSTCVWAKADTEPWYVALDEAGETVNYTINLTAKDEYLHSSSDGSSSKEAQVTGTIQLQRNRAHKLTIAPNYKPTTDGGLSITITIDESTIDHEITWEVPVTWI